MDWSGVDYLWIIVMFLSAVWTLILTAPIHCWASIAEQVMQWHISPNLINKQTHLHTVVNIRSGSKKLIKVVLRLEHILVLGFRTTLMKGFDPLQMLTSVNWIAWGWGFIFCVNYSFKVIVHPKWFTHPHANLYAFIWRLTVCVKKCIQVLKMSYFVCPLRPITSYRVSK